MEYPKDFICRICNDILDTRNSYLEIMAAAYLKLTDIPADEVELVEERQDTKIVFYFRRRETK